jgi:hypothetical protein
VQIVNQNANYSRDLYVMSVNNDSTPKTFTVKFNGAPPNSYEFLVTANSASKYGRLSTSMISFSTSSTVTSITPTSGSVLGGSLLTITGTNFSPVASDMAVKVGDAYCRVLSVNADGTEITCRILPTGYAVTDAGSVDLIVFLAASFEATCNDGNDASSACKFTYEAPIASITTLTPSFDATSNTLIMTMVGSGFTSGDISSVSLVIDGVTQMTRSVDSDTQAIFTITDVKNTSSQDVNVYFADGFAAGF